MQDKQDANAQQANNIDKKQNIGKYMTPSLNGQ